MASPAHFLLRLSIIIGLLSIPASAGRPCKTLFLISSYSFSIKPSYELPNPNPNPNRPFFASHSSRSGFITVVTEVSRSEIPLSSGEIFMYRGLDTDNLHRHEQHRLEEQQPVLPFGLSLSEYDFDSLRDRAKDILSVVVALLFGVGCGALTAATMYLAWSICYNRFEFGDSYSESDEEYDDSDDAMLEKIGYVKIPAAAPVKAVPEAPVKEVV